MQSALVSGLHYSAANTAFLRQIISAAEFQTDTAVVGREGAGAAAAASAGQATGIGSAIASALQECASFTRVI